ncbi:peroxiredoxin family protein, partial [Flavobacteriaceae bacterium]|nr:peroxiredoxin family protein [Flavobacteriaceae bacterium]
MNKRKILFAVAFCVVSLLSYLGYKVISKAKEKNAIAKQLETIPPFSFQTLEQKPFTNSNLKPNIPTIFIYFNSECDYCQYEAESISSNLHEFKNVQLIFVSTENIEIIRQFSEENKLNNQTNITFLQDSDYLFSTQ